MRVQNNLSIIIVVRGYKIIWFCLNTLGVVDGIEEEEEAVKISVDIWYVTIVLKVNSFLKKHEWNL